MRHTCSVLAVRGFDARLVSLSASFFSCNDELCHECVLPSDLMATFFTTSVTTTALGK